MTSNRVDSLSENVVIWDVPWSCIFFRINGVEDFFEDGSAYFSFISGGQCFVFIIAITLMKFDYGPMKKHELHQIIEQIKIQIGCAMPLMTETPMERQLFIAYSEILPFVIVCTW